MVRAVSPEPEGETLSGGGTLSDSHTGGLRTHGLCHRRFPGGRAPAPCRDLPEMQQLLAGVQFRHAAYSKRAFSLAR